MIFVINTRMVGGKWSSFVVMHKVEQSFQAQIAWEYHSRTNSVGETSTKTSHIWTPYVPLVNICDP